MNSTHDTVDDLDAALLRHGVFVLSRASRRALAQRAQQGGATVADLDAIAAHLAANGRTNIGSGIVEALGPRADIPAVLTDIRTHAALAAAARVSTKSPRVHPPHGMQCSAPCDGIGFEAFSPLKQHEHLNGRVYCARCGARFMPLDDQWSRYVVKRPETLAERWDGTDPRDLQWVEQVREETAAAPAKSRRQRKSKTGGRSQ